MMNISMNQHLAVVFDFGGVLIDWDPLHLYTKLFDGDRMAAKQFLDKIGFQAWNLRQDAGRPFAEAVEALCAQFPQDCELIRAYDTRWRESIAGPIQPTVAILRDLKGKGYPLYGFSNWSVEKFNLVRHEFEFLDWFDGIFLSGEVKLTKPDPRIFALLLERIGRRPQECVLVDDSIPNVQTARKLGFRTIHFQSPEWLRIELRSMGLL
jgi:2-haloacid dehalogenase